MQTSHCLSYKYLHERGRAWRPSKPHEMGGEGPGRMGRRKMRMMRRRRIWRGRGGMRRISRRAL